MISKKSHNFDTIERSINPIGYCATNITKYVEYVQFSFMELTSGFYADYQTTFILLLLRLNKNHEADNT